jgi:hypothetical protein
MEAASQAAAAVEKLWRSLLLEVPLLGSGIT